MKKAVSVILCLVLLLCASVSVNSVADNEEKIYCTATIKDDFAPDCVVVVFKKYASEINKVHTADEFPGIEIEKIEDLFRVDNPDENDTVNKENFHQIYKLTLKNKGKEEVLNAIMVLEQLDYIRSASPDYVVSSTVDDNQDVFPDVKYGSWYYDSVKMMANTGLMKGYANGTFGPGDNLQRQDFVIVLANLENVDLTKYENFECKFNDVQPAKYYTAAVNWAVSEDIIKGYQNSCFGVGDPITREQICTILYRYAGEPEVGEDAVKVMNGFKDSGNISAFAKAPIAWAIDSGIISGMADGRLAPTATASRAQIAKIIQNVIINIPQINHKDVEVTPEIVSEVKRAIYDWIVENSFEEFNYYKMDDPTEPFDEEKIDVEFIGQYSDCLGIRFKANYVGNISKKVWYEMYMEGKIYSSIMCYQNRYISYLEYKDFLTYHEPGSYSENYILSKKIHDNTATVEERQLYEEKLKNDEKLYSCATIDDDFADDRVLVTYKKSASIINKIHTADEFPGIEIESIKDLTYIEGSVDSKETLNKEEFHQILMITLKNKGKEEVLNAISLLENRDDIQYVGPDYHIALADTSKKNTSGLF